MNNLFNWIKSHKVMAALGFFLVFIIGIPVLIHNAFKTPAPTNWLIADWTSGDILSYYGVLLAALIAAGGVYITLTIEQKKYHEDVIRQSLPFFSLTTLHITARHNFSLPEKAVDTVSMRQPKQTTYKEERLDKVYIAINNGCISYKPDLSESEKQCITNAGYRWVKKGASYQIEAYSFVNIAFELENIGNGPTALTKLGFNRKNSEQKHYINVIPLKVNEKIYVHIICEDFTESDAGSYEIELFYSDIFNNQYRQLYNLTLVYMDVKRALTSIDMFGTQEPYEFIKSKKY